MQGKIELILKLLMEMQYILPPSSRLMCTNRDDIKHLDILISYPFLDKQTENLYWLNKHQYNLNIFCIDLNNVQL